MNAMRQRFKDRTLQAVYEAMRQAGADRNSELYLADGSRHTGAINRLRYWQGRDGITPVGMQEGTPAYACWRAGMDDRDEQVS